MINVTLIGTGNVSSHLKRVFTETKNVCLIKVIPGRSATLKKALSKEYPAKNNVYIIAVSDDAIVSVSKQLTNSNALIIHTSGSVAMNALPKEVRKGVFYPLQTFSKERKVNFKSVPICIEAEKSEDLELLKTLARSVSDSVYEISSAKRKSLHLAAVFTNNFTNHIYQIGNEICKENGVSFDILKPLITETVDKLDSMSPYEAQTGPARRHDAETIERQVKQIKNPIHRAVYQSLTTSIKETYGEKL